MNLFNWRKNLAEKPGGKLSGAGSGQNGPKTSPANFQPGLSTRARRYSEIISLLFVRMELAGRLQQVNRGARHLSIGVRLNDPTTLDKALNLAEPLALSCGVNNVLAQRIEGQVCYQIELPGAYWEFYTRADVSGLGVGLAEQRRPVDFELDPPHSLIAGTSGAGKSETLKSILVALLTSFGPDDLGLILIDPHNDYQDFQNEAHLALPIATEANEIQNALLFAHKELAQRKEQNIKDGKTLIVAIDEADQALSDGACLEVARSISKQARKYKIHLIIATQKPLHTGLPGILDNLLNKFVGQLVDAPTSAKVTGHAGLAAHKLTPKGDFLHITGPQVKRFQVAMASQADYARLERMEIKPQNAGPLAVLDLPGELPARQPGRPNLVLNPEYVAWYFYHNPEQVSRAMAQKMLGLSRDSHELHRDFARRFVAAYLKLRNSRMIGA